MASELPLWYGRERGASLGVLDLDFQGEDVEGEGTGRDGVAAGLVGFILPLAIIALVIAGGLVPVWAMALLALAGAGWLLGGLAAAWLAAFAEDPPPWALALVAAMVALGEIIAWVFIIVTAVVALATLVGLIYGLFRDGR